MGERRLSQKKQPKPTKTDRKRPQTNKYKSTVNFYCPGSVADTKALPIPCLPDTKTLGAGKSVAAECVSVRCDSAMQCSSLVCVGKLCQQPTCGDKVKNGAETAVDCGGGKCGACVGQACLVPAHCASGICTASVCVAAPI